MSNRKRVVVTGMGVISPVGLTIEEYWKSLLEGKSGVDYITRFDTTNFATKFAAEVKNFDPTNYMDKKLAQRMDIFTQFAMAATEMAIQDAGLNSDSKLDKERVAVVYSSGIGGMWTYHTQHELFFKTGTPRHISPFTVTMMIVDIAAGYISIRYGYKGPNYATISACASSANAITDAVMLIERGLADVVITGGSEAAICPMGIGSFNAMRALSTRNEEPQKASRPFDAQRDGFVMGEGAGTLVLESLEHALNRGAKIYAEVAGFGLTADAYHITAPAPNGEGAARSMALAIKDAGLVPEDIDYINAHGTSTKENDRNETQAIKTVFGDHAYKLAVNSTKSMIGHLLGAAGVVEAIATILSINTGKIHPTINYEYPDPECDLFYVPNQAIEREVKAAISNSFGFGGHNVSIVFKKFEE
ncbi:MAG: beta-ketoacyl-ACP synthase II [Candidatus Kryptonium sp.]|nr:beta-ketoacyl-ACP synthase II [Candidatus Kryptonium sp.]MCX7761281.1 beta-ketoacyl-ACP synthase II [Candidatus Kryptonium sp.]MDW8108890.1 beta-ketoacyl-ACP synthase II [Candidatus Kryptonium sp.]